MRSGSRNSRKFQGHHGTSRTHENSTCVEFLEALYVHAYVRTPRAFRGAIRTRALSRALITNSRAFCAAKRPYAKEKRKERKFISRPDPFHGSIRRTIVFASRDRYRSNQSVDIVSNLFHRYQFFLQIKQDILQGRLPVSFDLAAELGAYVVQCEISSEKARIGRARCLLFLVHTIHLDVVRLIKRLWRKTLKSRGKETPICTARSEYENLCTYAPRACTRACTCAHSAKKLHVKPVQTDIYASGPRALLI